MLDGLCGVLIYRSAHLGAGQVDDFYIFLGEGPGLNGLC
jgi:hypothetical protein